MNNSLPATRLAGLERLSAFIPKSGRDYAAKRNYDLPNQAHPHVSQLSPYLRHRLLTEEEVLQAVLGRYSSGTAEKFIQEVYWRTYWKGWLEMRPQVWSEYRQTIDRLAHDDRIHDAEAGRTEIAAFNAWAQELVETGYLHNHARMWFASIWIFTLQLPWAAGADFFMRHLLDGDPASNTLSWKWVAGLQTQGKHYLARSSNISKYTEGRHNPEWRLNTQAEPLDGPPHPPRRPLPESGMVIPGLRTGLLLHEDDLSPGWLLDSLPEPPVCHTALVCVDARSSGQVSDGVKSFAQEAIEDCLARWSARMGAQDGPKHRVDDVVVWAKAAGLQQLVTPYGPVGPVASALRKLERALNADGIDLVQPIRAWDAAAWPHATHGFFRFKKCIPGLVSRFSTDTP